MQTRHRISLLLLSLWLTLGLASEARAYPEYRVTVVGPAGSTAADINNAGVVAGTYRVSPSSTHAFLNRGKGLVDLGTLGGTNSNAVAINDKGQVLGNWTSGGQQRGFIYSFGKQRDIGAIPGYLTRYTDINKAGYITAIGSSPDFYGPHGFLRAPDGSFTDIGFLPFDNPITNAYALNNKNQITGESGPLLFPEQPVRAFIWTKGAMRDLGDLGFDINAGLAINDCGQVTGFASLPVGFHARHAFLYSNGRMRDIDGRPLTETQENFSEGTGINCLGYVVGSSDHLSGFIYRGKRMQSLNALIDPHRGWDISAPKAINNAGQIAATAYRHGRRYAVRLDLIRPLPEVAPEWPLDDDAAVASPLSPAQAREEAQAEAEAQARETVRSVQQ